MKEICPSCEKMTEIEFIKTQESFMYNDNAYVMDVEYYVCAECGCDFEDPKSEYDPIKKVYEMDRRRLIIKRSIR